MRGSNDQLHQMFPLGCFNYVFLGHKLSINIVCKNLPSHRNVSTLHWRSTMLSRLMRRCMVEGCRLSIGLRSKEVPWTN